MMTDTSAKTNIDINELVIEGNIETPGSANQQQKSTAETVGKPSDQTKAAFGMFSSVSGLSGFDLNALKPQDWISKRRETLKPWTEFMNYGKFKKPTGVSQATGRVVRNLAHFQSNYLFVFIFLAIYCVLTSPYLLFAFMAIAGGCYIVYLKNKDGNLKFMGKEFKLAQMYSIMGLCSIPLFLLAGAGSALFWIIGASVFCILLHAIFYARDEQEDPFTAQMNNIV